MNINTNQVNNQKYLKPSMVAEELSVNYRTIMTMIHSGEIRAIKVGGSYRISRGSLNEYLVQSEVKVPTI